MNRSQPPIDGDGARIHDLRLEGASEAYLVEPMDGGPGAAVLFLHCFDIEAPDGDRTDFLIRSLTL